MAMRATHWTITMAAAWLLLAASPAHAQNTPTYKCVSKGRVVYSQIPCPGGRELGVAGPRRTDKHKAPPQDRATIARRSRLSPEDKQECKALDERLKQQEGELKAMGASATLQDEMPLVKNKQRFRELRC
jgi:hypothetical protein